MFCAFAGVLLSICSLAQAASISGVVTNRTTGKPAAGDDVTLVRLAQGMQEAGRTKTDAKGRFTLDIPDNGIHLVRVTHDKANYFQPVEPGAASIDVDVYTAAAKVDGVAEEADVMRLQTDADGKGLQVVEHFFIKNDSTPPKTQFSEKPFEFYLPPGAVVEGSAALAPGGMPVQSAPVPLGDANHYAFIFPLRPGETQFQITYKLPYAGSFAFAPKPVTAVDTVAVMMPKTMVFAAAPAAPYATVTDEVNAQAYVARNVQPGEALAFTVSGSGQLPKDTQASAAQSPAGSDSGDVTPAEASARQRADTKPGVGLNNPLDSQGELEPWAKYKWWIFGGLGLVLAAGAGLMLKGGAVAGPADAVLLPEPEEAEATGVEFAGPSALLAALKDEMFALETDRLEGRIGEAEYAEHKRALDVVLRRALGRSR